MRKQRKRNSVNRAIHKVVLLPTLLAGVGLAGPAMAQAQGTASASGKSSVLEEIVVTAQRRQQRLQDVPISVSVFNQSSLNKLDVTNGSDLATYTPSLSVNNRFGTDQSSFSIRGFTQELRTTASVGVYFADVVAPRGGGSVTAGDGAGPGDFFDLKNVQVLKGPQGTLFGRNTTGGAILLVPNKPTDRLEGYIKGGVGNYNMRRAQGVLNVPLSDWARARFGIDTKKRDGYINNISGIGPKEFSDVDYVSYRASLVLDPTDSLENYTIATYANSKNNGTLQSLFACKPDGILNKFFSGACDKQLAEQGKNFYRVDNPTPQPYEKLKQWQVINTTTWTASDNLTVKNIMSYADLKQTMRTAVFGTNFPIKGTRVPFAVSGTFPGLPTNSQISIVEELQFQGHALENHLTWQSGLYFENSQPDGLSGSQSPFFMPCQGYLGRDPSTWQCQNVTLGGLVQRQTGKIEYLNKAVYGQATYDISDQFRVTGGLRYTDDTTKATSKQLIFRGFPTASYGAPTSITCMDTALSIPCKKKLRQHSNAPTWMIDFDYLPTEDMLLYAKYTRGYRQGALNIFGPQGYQNFDQEKVDAYEIGFKATFDGVIPGRFDTAYFYNKLHNQQLQVGFPSGGGVPTTGIVNAGRSTIQGLEVETTLQLLQDLTFNFSYTYLNTHLDFLQGLAPSPFYGAPDPTAVQGRDLTFSPHNSLSTGLNYTLPLPASVGDVSAGVNYVYTSSQISSDASSLGTIPSYELFNFNLNWQNIFGSDVDAAAFVTNAFGEKYTSYVPGLYDAIGFEGRVVGPPRMWGVSLKYSFGS